MKRLDFLLLALAGACGGPHFGPPLPPYHGGPATPYDGGPEEAAKKAHMASIASLRERAIGPYVALGDKGAMAAYVAGAAPGASSRELVVVPLDATGAPKLQARVVARTTPDTSTLMMRHVGGGYVLAWTTLTDRGESLSTMGLNDAGEVISQTAEIERTPDHIVWVELVSTSHGAVCVWAEEPPQGSADVLAQSLDANGRLRGVPSRALRDASSWEAVAWPGTRDGVALAIVQKGALSLARLDAEARLVGEPLPVAPAVGADMDMVRAGSSLLFAWTDRTRVDAQLVVAGVDAQNKVVAPHDALPGEGSSMLVGLASGDHAGLVIWEPAHKRDRVVRRVNLATVTDPATLVTKGALDLAGGSALEARSLGDGWALLGFARACSTDPAAGCGAVAPTFVRLDGALSVVQTEALVNGPPVTLAWGMDCNTERCLALAAGPDLPTAVYAVDLSNRTSTHAPPVPPTLADDAPRLASTSTALVAPQVSDVAAIRVGDAELIATMTPAASGSSSAQSLRLIPVSGGKLLPAVTLSTTALATGGLGVAPGPGPHEATIVYVASSGGAARVHVARVDDHGARKSDMVLQGGAKGDASDVAITAVPNGYVAAWVDTRDGNGEVYACKLTNGTPGAAVRITNAPGDATDTTLAFQNGSVLLAWADPRESPHDGFADIYAVALSPKDARPLDKEGRVLSTAAHSRSPTLARTARGIALAWIEEAPAGAASDEARGAMFVMLDEHARPVRDPLKLKLSDAGTVTAITLADDPQARLLHATVARTSQDELWLDAVRIPLDAGGSVESFPLFALDGPSSMDEALSLDGDELVYSDEGGPDDARVKRAVIRWGK